MARIVEKINDTGLWWGKLKGADHLEDRVQIGG